MKKNENWLDVLNSELSPENLILSYANHTAYCSTMKITPCSEEKFLKKEVSSSFRFKESKEGAEFWIFLLRFEMLVDKETKEYLKEKEKAYYRGLFSSLLLPISALIFLIILIHLLSYL